MPPTGGITGDRNADITYQLRGWNRQTKLGKVFDSSTGFKLPNGAKRSPDASWIPLAKWNALSDEEKEKFLPLCPDFVVELRSSSDALKNPGKNAIIFRKWGEIRLVNRPAKKSGINLSAIKRSGNIRKSPNCIRGKYFTRI